MSADCKVTIIMLGESGVGKTSLVLRYFKKIFRAEHVWTSVEYYTKPTVVRDKEIKLEVWDTAGQERFKSIIKEKADGVLLVYDMTNITSFHKLSSWLEELRNLNETAEVLIVGNKSDLPNLAAVTGSTVKKYARDEGVDYFETSAKINENVDKIFEYLAEKVLLKKKMIPNDTIILGEKEKKRKSCC